MTKELLKQYFQNSLDAKNQMLQANSLSEEDKAMLENQVAAITDIIAKLDESENDVTAEQLEEVKNSVNELNEKLTALNERINLNKNNEDNKEPEMENTLKNYLESKNALHDFANAMRGAKNAEEFRNAWLENIKLQNADYADTISSLDDAENFMPAAVKGIIDSIWDNNASFLKNLRWTGAKRYVARYNGSDQDAENSRAKGHKKGDTKASQKLSFTSKLIDAQYVYKLVELSKQTLFESDEELIRYVYTECTEQLIWEVKRAILVGDGRQDNDPYKIDKIEAIYKDTSDAYTTVFSVGDAGTTFYIDDVRMAVDSIHNPNSKPVTVFMNKATLRKLSRVQASETSTPVYLDTETVATQIGCSEIITTDLLEDDAMIAVILGEYYMVGEDVFTPTILEWEDGLKNIWYHRAEVVLGGALKGLKSSAVIYVSGM